VPEKHGNQFPQFLSRLYHEYLNNRKDVLMALLMALCSDQEARSVVELSLNLLFPYDYTSLFKAIVVHQPEKATLSMAELGVPYGPLPWHGRFHILGADYTSNPRPHAYKLSERECVYKPNPIKGQKPITLGHEYHHINALVEKSGPHCPPWSPPLSAKRVCRKDRERSAIDQMRTLLGNSSLPYSREPCIQVGDSQFSTPAYLAAFSQKPNLLTLVRSRGNRVYNFPAPLKVKAGQRGRQPVYGPRMDLKDPASWPQPDETAIFSQTTYRGKPRIVEVQAWHNLLMRGHRKKADLPMHKYPFTLVRVRIYDDQMRLLFPDDPLWLMVMGKERHQLSPQDIYEVFGLRSGIEHFFRFAKGNLLLDKFQTPDTKHEEHWWQLATLAYLCLWVAKDDASLLPRPWEKSLPQVKEKHISPTMVKRSFARIIRQFDHPSRVPPTGKKFVLRV
jgi:hypothetical protein